MSGKLEVGLFKRVLYVWKIMDTISRSITGVAVDEVVVAGQVT